MLDLKKYRSEFLRALNNFHYELSPQGVYFSKQKSVLNGVFAHRLNDEALEIDPNTWTFTGLSDLLRVYFKGLSQATGFYIAPFSNSAAPAQSLDAAHFASVMQEFVGYSETTRPAWQSDAEANQTVANPTTPGRLTISTGPSNIYGAALIRDASAKSATSGLLCAIAQFANPRLNLVATDKLDIEYTITALDAG